MNKFFYTLFWGLFATLITPCFADVLPIVDMDDFARHEKNEPEVNPVNKDDLPNPNNQEEVREFFKKRLENAAMSKFPEGMDLSVPTSVNVVHTQEYYKAKEESQKTLFQKMYEDALKAIHKQDDNQTASQDENWEDQQKEVQQATRFFMLDTDDTSEKEEYAEIPTVSFALPSGRRVLAPALEHIPYFLSYIDVQSNGYLKIEDTIVTVANGEKFSQAIQRIFPKFVYGKNNKKQHVEFILEDVQINSTSVPYMLEEVGNDVVFKPKYMQKLENGVYTYTFKYMVNYRLIRDEDDVYLDWSILGKPLNAFITSANAILSMPSGHTYKAAEVVVGKKGQYSANRTNAYSFAKNVLAFSNFTPLFSGENMEVIAIMDKNAFMKDFDKGFGPFMNDWGKTLYAGLGFAAVFLSFVLSLISLKKEKKNSKYNPSYNGSLMRHISVGKYDRVAFVSQILDLFRKDALDLEEKDGQSVLIKKNIANAKLNKIEKKALKLLFAKKTQKIAVNNQSNNIFKKVKKLFENANNKQIKKFRLKHNIGYVIFSCAMLISTEIFIALISINAALSLIVLFSASLLYALYVWILWHRFKKRSVAIVVKILSLCAIAFIWMFSSVYIGGLTNLIILAMIITIFGFTRIFGEYNNFINEAKGVISNYKEFLINNADSINLSRDFLNQQSNIYALDITEYFAENVANRKYNRFEAAEALRKNLVGII